MMQQGPLRSGLGAVVGYVCMVIVVMTFIGVAWMILGGKGAFSGETAAPSGAWIAMNLFGGLVAALVGGWVASRVGASRQAVTALIVLVLAIGLILAVMPAKETVPLDKSVAELSFMEAGQYAQNPAWYNWIIPLVGALGVWIGGRRS